jgi:lysophospholipase L1-like esterase
VLWLLSLVAVIATVALAAVAYSLNAISPPPPHAIGAAGPKPAGVRRVVGLGASIVQGGVSAPFIDRLRERLGPGWEVWNAGRNRELAWNVAQRLEPVIRAVPDHVFVLVGSNDVMASLGPKEERSYRRAMKLPQAPSLEFYRDNLARVVRELRSRTSAQVTLCALPFLGEDLASDVNQTLRRYNQEVRAVAEREGARFLDVYEHLEAALPKGVGRPLPRGFLWVLKAACQRALLGWSYDRIGRANGFHLLSDGIHLGERAGERVAELLEGHLRQVALTTPADQPSAAAGPEAVQRP